MSLLRVNIQRLRQDFEQLAQIGQTSNGGINRLALSNEDLQARAWFANRIEDAGFSVHDDDAGNLSGVLNSSSPNAKTLLLGSHLDSVPNGGKYDGAVGILSALECLRTLDEARYPLPFHLEVIDFTDDEGCWISLFGSKALSGKLPSITQLERETEDRGAALRAALTRAGIHPADLHRAKRDPNTLLGYLELHVEQGARLYRQQAEIGIVNGIVGRSTFRISFFGEASHSGTTAIEDRRDALQGAAFFITKAYQTLQPDNEGRIFNCGNIDVSPGAFNIIPARATLTVECRHTHQRGLADMESTLIRLAHESAIAHHLTVNVKKTVHMPAAILSPRLINAIHTACQTLKIPDPLPMVSYAGHDAQMLSDFIPCGMIFIPSYRGISHNPAESADWRQIEQGANVLLHTILTLADQGGGSPP
ncbi:MAG: M20 family metallo-hydrolase [Anaerolineae bacterium]|jgi:N-carbamoyl-L-amino-acid hydrolase|nr:M20 family metallo-hydrolase [Anaerolineae bacterium]